MGFDLDNKNLVLVSTEDLYKWASVWGSLQRNYYKFPVQLRREKQIKDFILLNEFKNIYLERDTDVLESIMGVPNPEEADLIVITDQKFSRRPCHGIVERINILMAQCPRMFICLNRHYINIDNTYHDNTLSEHYTLAVTQWLKKSLPNCTVIDMSLDYADTGDHFTWVIPDRMYYIEVRT
jgi:hypothetical protein